jgi:hypothetical protein
LDASLLIDLNINFSVENEASGDGTRRMPTHRTIQESY